MVKNELKLIWHDTWVIVIELVIMPTKFDIYVFITITGWWTINPEGIISLVVSASVIYKN
jgi:hypothetical protein